jgi:hypothetical protein
MNTQKKKKKKKKNEAKSEINCVTSICLLKAADLFM